MRTNIAVAAIMVLIWTCVAFAEEDPAEFVPQQAAPIYDPSYRGPVNYWGQPAYSVPQGQPQQQAAEPQQHTGYFFRAAEGVQAVGSYLWGYAPAPLRGAPPPFAVQPNAGQVIINHVPGVR
jgi:hypothetical protein